MVTSLAPLDDLRKHFSQSVLGDAISVDQKDYYCIEIGLPDAPKGPTTELFMLDTAATSSLLTPRAYERLGGGLGFAWDTRLLVLLPRLQILVHI